MIPNGPDKPPRGNGRAPQVIIQCWSSMRQCAGSRARSSSEVAQAFRNTQGCVIVRPRSLKAGDRPEKT